jgi:hypothetical protein
VEEVTFDQLPPLDKLATALAKAQASFPAVPKTGQNPFLKNEYATLDDIIGAVRKPLGDNGLSFVQLLGSNGGMMLRTILLHESGQMLESAVTITPGPAKGVNDLQALGAAITYMKRYVLGAMLGVATDGDTDGEGAGKDAGKQSQKRAASTQEKPTDAPHHVASRPLPPEKLRPGLRFKAGWHKIGDDYKRITDGEPITEKQVGFVASRIEGLFKNLDGGIRTKARYDVMNYLYGVTTVKDLTKLEASALIDWTEDVDAATQEAAQIINALAIEAGQQELEL